MIGTTQKRGKEGAVVNILTSNSMLMLQRSMGFLWSKQDCILNNLANAETPGYKTQYVTFEESLRDAVQAAADKPQPGAAMREAIADTPVQLHEAQESVRMGRQWGGYYGAVGGAGAKWLSAPVCHECYFG